MELNLVKYLCGVVPNGLRTVPWWSKELVSVLVLHNPHRNWMSSAV